MNTYSLEKQIQTWLHDGLIDSITAQKLLDSLPASSQEPETQTASLAPVIFGGLGALTIGLGIILLIGFNWADMGKYAKLASILIPFIGAHTLGLLLLKYHAAVWKRETVYLLTSLLFGAAIALIAQIYHINEHFPNGFLLAGLGSAVLFVCLRSVPQGILTLIIFAFWFFTEIDITKTESIGVQIAPYAAIVLFGFSAYWMRSAVMAVCAFLALIMIVFGYSLALHSQLFSCLPLIGLFFIARALALPETGEFRAVRAVLRILPTILMVVIFYIYSFDFPWRETLRFIYPCNLFVGVMFLLTLVFTALYFWREKTAGLTKEWIRTFVLPLLGAGLLFFGTLSLPGRTGGALPIPLSLVLLTMSAWGIWTACRKKHIVALTGWTLTLGGWLSFRFFEWFDNLAERGVAFLSMGILLIGIAVLYIKLTPKTKEGA